MKFDAITTATRKQNFRHAKVLIIDDNQDHLTVIEGAIRHCLPEVEPILALNEDAAFTYLNECSFHEWKLPKLILLDIYMPRCEDGWHILQRIKSMPQPASMIPVVMLSYSENKSDIRTAYDNGSSSYLVKPTNMEGWMSCFQRLRSYWWETVSLPQAGYRM